MRTSVLHVVIPAHDEEQQVGQCLVGVAAAIEGTREHHPELDVRTTVILDGCTDGTAAIVAAFEVDVLAIDARSVGAARRAGVAHARQLARSTDPAAVWIATTDADSVAPPTWLLDHLRLSREHDAVVGRVRPDPTGLSSVALLEWERRHPPGGRFVHGANLGFRLSAYDAVGGFQVVPEHEDVQLVAALHTAGFALAHGSEVVTSARQVGRTGGGFAGYLAALSAFAD